jgi:hypothetical protein
MEKVESDCQEDVTSEATVASQNGCLKSMNCPNAEWEVVDALM